MATFLDVDPDMFGSTVYGQKHPETVQFLRNTYNATMASLQNIGGAFAQAVTSIYDRYTSVDAERRLTAMARNLQSGWIGNQIKPMVTIGALQTAPMVMQRYIMACPDVRRVYQQDMCEGYKGSYVDNEKGQIGDTHYDYRRVMHGMFQENAEGVEYATTYFDDHVTDEAPLNIYEQRDIRDTWAAAASAMLAHDDDPTSRWNASL